MTARKQMLYVETSAGVYMPVGYIRFGFPVLYGWMWRMLHLDFSLPRPPREEGPVV